MNRRKFLTGAGAVAAAALVPIKAVAKPVLARFGRTVDVSSHVSDVLSPSLWSARLEGHILKKGAIEAVSEDIFFGPDGKAPLPKDIVRVTRLTVNPIPSASGVYTEVTTNVKETEDE